MSVLDKFLDAIRLNDDYEEEDADSDSFFDEEDDDIEEKPKKRFFRKLENEDECRCHAIPQRNAGDRTGILQEHLSLPESENSSVYPDRSDKRPMYWGIKTFPA